MKHFLMAFVLFFIIIGCRRDNSVKSSPPEILQAKPEIYAQVPYAVGNIAYNYKRELVYSNHPFFDPEIRVMHYNPVTKKSTPFPNLEWNTPNTTNENYLDSVLGIRNDSKGVVWMLDIGSRTKITPKLVGWNTQTNQLEKIYKIPAPASIPTSQLQDFVIDEKRQIIVMADEDIAFGGNGSKAALVILDMNDGSSKRVLDGHYSTVPENIPIADENGGTLKIPNTDKPILVGADGITLDKDNHWLYYAPLNGTSVYRITMNDLLNTPQDQLGSKVERYSDKRNNGGLSIDIENNIYLSYLSDEAIGIIPAKGERKSQIYASDPKMIWPDGISYNDDGYLYTGAAQLSLAAIFNGNVDKTQSPYYIYRIKTVAPGIWGR